MLQLVCLPNILLDDYASTIFHIRQFSPSVRHSTCNLYIEAVCVNFNTL